METKNDQTFMKKLKAYGSHPFSGLMAALIMLAALLTFCILIFLVIFILVKGVRYLTPDLFARNIPQTMLR